MADVYTEIVLFVSALEYEYTGYIAKQKATRVKLPKAYRQIKQDRSRNCNGPRYDGVEQHNTLDKDDSPLRNHWNPKVDW